MKIFKLIGVIAVIGIGLCASTVHAQVPFSRVVDLECVPFNPVYFCGAAGAHGQLVINFSRHGNATSGAHSNFPSFTDGEPHPYVVLDVYSPCRSDFNSGPSGPKQFYVLYITLDHLASPPGATVRIISFNTDCYSFHRKLVVRLPAAITPTDWFTKDLKVQVIRDFDDGVDSSAPVVLEGID